jgi:hypothetical protein
VLAIVVSPAATIKPRELTLTREWVTLVFSASVESIQMYEPSVSQA